MNSPAYDATTLAILLAVQVAFIIFYGVPLIIASVMLFRKAGSTAAAAIVPFYSTYVMTEIARRPKFYAWALIVLSLVLYFPSLPAWTALLVTACTLALTVYILVGFARQYDKKAGYWVLYMLVPAVAVFMTKSARYVGPKD